MRGAMPFGCIGTRRLCRLDGGAKRLAHERSVFRGGQALGDEHSTVAPHGNQAKVKEGVDVGTQ